MVKFNIAKADLKYLFNVTKSSMGCVGLDKKCQYVKFTGRDSHLQAFSLDGYRAHIAAAPIDILEGNQHFPFYSNPSHYQRQIHSLFNVRWIKKKEKSCLTLGIENS